MSLEHILNLMAAACGLIGVAVTTYDLAPDYRLHQARRSVMWARHELESLFYNGKLEMTRAGTLPSGPGTVALSTQYQLEATTLIRAGGLSDELAGKINAAFDRAASWLGDKPGVDRTRFLQITYTSKLRAASPDEVRKMAESVQKEVRRLSDFEMRLLNRERTLEGRNRPPILLGAVLVALGFLFQGIISFLPVGA